MSMQKLTFFRSTSLSVIVFLISLLSISVFGESPDPVKAKNGMVVTAHPLATKVGLQILKKGGNAVDAAVAVGFALAVTYPVAGNIGGGGFMVIHLANQQDIAIDYREMAPFLAHRDMYLDSVGNFLPELSQDGILSVGIPGSVAGLIFALQKYGTMKLADVIQPAINLAELGFSLSEYDARSFNSYKESFIKYPSTAKIFVKPNSSFAEGELFKQPDLAKTLVEIKNNGVKGFYEGWVAENIVKTSNSLGGIINKKDLLNYKVVEREVIKSKYRDFTVISMPPPSSGGIALVQMLNIIENVTFEKKDFGSSEYYHLLVEAMKRAYADRSVHLGDPDFFNVPQKWLISKKYADILFNQISDDATPSELISPGDPLIFQESEETTHYSVADKFGNLVSVTTTINSGYGSKVVVDGCGFFLNNEMDDFSAKPGTPNQFGLIGGTANQIEPNKRMLSSMTPTIVLKNGKPFLVLGSPGGSTIITVVLQVILNCIDFGMDIRTAIDMPRIHHQWFPDQIYYEEFGLSEDVKENLLAKGHKLGEKRKLGLVEGILIDSEKGIFYGASDSRGSGTAEGY